MLSISPITRVARRVMLPATAVAALLLTSNPNAGQVKINESNKTENALNNTKQKDKGANIPYFPLSAAVLLSIIPNKKKVKPKELNLITEEKLADKDYVPLDRDILWCYKNGYTKAGNNLISHPNFDITNKEKFIEALKETYNYNEDSSLVADSYITYAVDVLKDEEVVTIIAKKLLSNENYDLNAINCFGYTDAQYLMKHGYFKAARMYIDDPRIDILKRTKKHDISYIDCAAMRKDIDIADEKFVNHLVDKTISNPDYDPNKENHRGETDFDILVNHGYGISAKKMLNLPEFNNVDLVKITWAAKAEVKAAEDAEIMDTMIDMTLVNPDFNPNKAYSDGITALHELIKSGYYNAAKKYINNPKLNILQKTKEESSQTREGESYLGYAARHHADSDLVELIARKMISNSDYFEKFYSNQANHDLANLVLGSYYDIAKMMIDYIQNQQREYNKRITKS